MKLLHLTFPDVGLRSGGQLCRLKERRIIAFIPCGTYIAASEVTILVVLTFRSVFDRKILPNLHL